MRKVTNNNAKAYSVETEECGFHALQPGETALVDVRESKIEEYRSKGFEISEPEEAKKASEDDKDAKAQQPSSGDKDAQATAKKPDAPATQAGSATDKPAK